MAQEVGVAYVSLLPSGKGFSKAIESEADKGFSGANKTSNRFFDGVTKWAKRGAVVIGGMVTAVAGLAAGGGIARALNIEDATAKLRGLGHDTKAVEAIMNDALASVKGTAFGLDAAATVAASAVAAGIEPGKELERHLRLTADAATIAGTSLDEMGSILNQVTSKGYAGMENLNRLTERGIPILQWLQDEYGVTADELAKMVSRGEIDAETFRKAIEDNIGGAALESGNTTRGAFANMMAALSRLGLAFTGDALPQVKTFFNEVTLILDGLESRVGPWVDRLQDKLGGFVQIEGLSDRFLTGFDKFVDLLSNLDSTPLGIMLKTLEPLLPLMRELGEEIGPVLADTFMEIWEAIEPLVPLLSEALVDAIIQLAPPLTDLLVALLPLLPPLVELVLAILPPLITLLELLIPPVVAFIEELTNLADAFVGATDVLSGDTTFEELGRTITEQEGPLGSFGQAFVGLVSTLTAGLGGLGAIWGTSWQGMSTLFTTVGTTIETKAKEMWNMLPAEFRSGVERAVNWVKTLPDRVKAELSNAGQWLVDSGKSLIQGFINGITSMLPGVGDAVDGILSWASGFFPHSPAKRGTFSGAGWTAVAEGGASLMEQFAFGVEKFKPEISFGNLTGMIGNITGIASAPNELVVRDVNDQLVGRMRVEANRQVGEFDAFSERLSSRGVRLV